MDAGALEDAETILEHALEIDPENSSVLILLGDICKKKGDLNSAIEIFKKTCGIEPRNEWARMKLALTYKESGKKKDAQREFKLLASSSDYNIREAAKWHLDNFKKGGLKINIKNPQQKCDISGKAVSGPTQQVYSVKGRNTDKFLKSFLESRRYICTNCQAVISLPHLRPDGTCPRCGGKTRYS